MSDQEDSEQYPRALHRLSRQIKVVLFCIFVALVCLWAYTMFINMRPV